MQINVVKIGVGWVVVWSIGDHKLVFPFDTEHAARAYAKELRTEFAQKSSHSKVTGSFKDTFTR